MPLVHVKWPQLLSFLFPLVLAGCEIYQSGGRTLFEANAPTKITNTNLSPQSRAAQTNGCFQQASQSSLSWIPPQTDYNLKFITNDIIEVCFAQNTAADSK